MAGLLGCDDLAGELGAGLGLFGAEGNDRIERRGGTDDLGATEPGDTIIC